MGILLLKDFLGHLLTLEVSALDFTVLRLELLDLLVSFISIGVSVIVVPVLGAWI